MLHQISIRDFAIVDRLDVEWAPGLNVITGETGAGKSIIVDAIGALLGDRLGPEVVRTGATRALVEGVFFLDGKGASLIRAALDEYGLEAEDEALVVARDLAPAGGRGGARVNGRALPLSTLQDLGELLVDVHGQSQHMALLRTREQLNYLDRYAGTLPLRAHVAELVGHLRGIREDIRALQSSEREAAREQQMLRFEIDEIESVGLRDDEEQELLDVRRRLQHVERLRHASQAAYEALSGVESGDSEVPGAVELLGTAARACEDGAQFDPSLVEHGDALQTALVRAEDASRGLRSYLDGLEMDPEELERVEDRLLTIAGLKRKYGGSVADALGYLAEAHERLARVENREERLVELSLEEQRVAVELAGVVSELSSARARAGGRLAQRVGEALADLNMGGSTFQVAIRREPDEAGLELDGQRVAVDATGVDRVELLVSANPGEEPRSMARVASGGELARIALALKTALSQTETRATLIFDEVDSGVGGRTAPVVGQKLWRLAADGHQVFCVTHLAQVAAYADRHWVVAKEMTEGRTRTAIRAVESEERLAELAAMLAGSASASAVDSARELVRQAETFKTHG